MNSLPGEAPFHHLAQVNIARMRAPLDSPVMAGFVAQLAPLNAIADASPGFVWRLATEEGDATALRAFEDDTVLVNLSVWDSPQALRSYTYAGEHVAALRARQQWFEPTAGPHYALWWVPAGHTPTVAEARERLDYLGMHGDSPFAFLFPRLVPAPAVPERHEPSADVRLAPVPIDYDRRTFSLRGSTANGDCGSATQFHYRQRGARVWAHYGDDHIRFGSLVAVADAAGCLAMTYQHLDADRRLRSGRCRTTPELLPDGRLRLHEQWEWTEGGTGSSVLEEIRSEGSRNG